MKIRVNECYDNGRQQFVGLKEVQVIRVTTDRIEYREIYSWDCGWPRLGAQHSASHASFERQYPRLIEPVGF